MSTLTTQPRADTAAQPRRGTAMRRLMLGALGVVYGDIGTSPLYTVKQCFDALGGADAGGGLWRAVADHLGAIIVVTLKYVSVIMRADNRGEGGILALTALALRAAEPGTQAALVDPRRAACSAPRCSTATA